MSAGTSFTLDFKSGQRIERLLNLLPAKTAEKAFKKGGNKAGQRLVRDARARAPKVTGELRRNIGKTTKVKSRGRRGAYLTVRIGMRTDQKRRGFVGRLIEKGKSKKHHAPTRPFLEPAVDARKDEMVRIFSRETAKAAIAAARKLMR